MRLQYSVQILQIKFCIVLLFLFITTAFYGQSEPANPQPVTAILKQIEKQFDVSFSYNRRDLRKIRCEIPESATLESKLENLSANCGIQFYRIDERYIAVTVGDSKLISICGTLIETTSGAPLSGASVIGNGFQSSTGRGGQFTISGIPEDAILSVYHMGFKVQEITAAELNSENGCPQVFIEQRFNYLPAVLLNSYLTKGIYKHTEGSVSISNRNYEILPSLIEPDVLRIAQILPGIESFNETASNINIRGGKSDESLLLWDDIRMYQSGHFFGLISAFNPNLTQNVTIYKSGTHPRYGESVSGVISMKSDSDIPEHVTGAASLDFISTQFYAKIPASERFAFHVSGRTSINTGLGNPVYNQFFKRVFQNTVVTNFQNNTSLGLRSTDEAFNFYDINGKAIWQLTDKDKFQYSFLTIFNKLNFTERFTGETTLSKNVSELKQQTLVHGLSWEREWTSKFSSTVMYSFNDYVNNGGNQNEDTGQVQSQRNDISENQLSVSLNYSLNSDISLNAGFQHTETIILNEDSPFAINQIFISEKQLTSDAFYANSKWNLFEKKTTVSAGVRFTTYSELDQQFLEPRITIFQKINDNFSVNTSFEQKHQSVAQNIDVDNSLLGIENERWIILGSSNQPILENVQVTLGTTYALEGWSIGIEGFYKKVEGINSMNQGFRNQLSDVDALGAYTSQGLEFSISKQTERLNAWLSYTYMDNEFNFDTLDPPVFRSNFDVTHALSLAASYSWKSFLFSLGTTYHSGIPYTTPVEGNAIVQQGTQAMINFNSPNNATLQDFFRTDFSASYTLPLDDTFTGKLSAGMVNIFNRKNALDSYYVLDEDDEGTTVLNRVEQFSLGFTPNVSLKLLF